MDTKAMPADVEAAFDAMPEAARQGCLALRALVLGVARDTPEAGRVSEELRWGQPAYLTPETKSGTTIRLGAPKSGGFALFVHCQTSLIEDFRPIAPEGTRFDGKRAVLFDKPEEVQPDALGLLVRAALTYHL
ncbi:DUF1801 domain-containing protein [Rhodobacteraceae bacterium D3-12]|nr:DUF1801 domain-containing protein [Rhodobacteraceae bacterium D3-12]